MNYHKPEVAVLGSAEEVICGVIVKNPPDNVLDPPPDTVFGHLDGAYDLDE